MAAGATGNDIVYLRRLHSIHLSNKDFTFISGERCIFSSSQNIVRVLTGYVRLSLGLVMSFCSFFIQMLLMHLIIYVCWCTGYLLAFKVHGNSKAATPFYPMWPSTKEHIKQECLEKGPESTLSTISYEAGGIVGASAPGLLPRNEKQVSNFKRKLSFHSRISKTAGLSHDAAADVLFVVMQQAYSDDPSHRFVPLFSRIPPSPNRLMTSSKVFRCAVSVFPVMRMSSR